MKVPTHLSHKPIVVVNDYESIDAQYANHTDTKGLSIGRATYNSEELSLKVWRHTGQKWSRQSEEIPLHRVIDLTILLLSAFNADDIHNTHYPKSLLKEQVVNSEDLAFIKEYYQNHKQYLLPRFKELECLLSDFDI